MAKSFRTTISVPMDLKARMDAVDEPVNWSRIACKAFEEELKRIKQGELPWTGSLIVGLTGINPINGST